MAAFFNCVKISGSLIGRGKYSGVRHAAVT